MPARSRPRARRLRPGRGRSRLRAVPSAIAPSRPIVCGPWTTAYPGGRRTRKRKRRANQIGIAARRRRLHSRRPNFESADSLAEDAQLLAD
eukprot:1936318-Alexandrium_andersonii.AAC.1